MYISNVSSMTFKISEVVLQTKMVQTIPDEFRVTFLTDPIFFDTSIIREVTKALNFGFFLVDICNIRSEYIYFPMTNLIIGTYNVKRHIFISSFCMFPFTLIIFIFQMPTKYLIYTSFYLYFNF